MPEEGRRGTAAAARSGPGTAAAAEAAPSWRRGGVCDGAPRRPGGTGLAGGDGALGAGPEGKSGPSGGGRAGKRRAEVEEAGGVTEGKGRCFA